MDYQEVTLDTLNMGAARELFEASWQRLLDNIGDENTKATAVRSIAITVKVKPNDQRSSAETTVSIVERLAPLNPHEHFIVLSGDGQRVQAYTADPKQQVLGLEEPGNVTPFAAGTAGR
jgi:hypothetical protein